MKYKEKRDFSKTSEPKTFKKSADKPLRFCVQKHAARHLHYDFRLECCGVLLSWAVPKGPSLDPKDKRLAIHVEDHPVDYQYFEGVIPKGNYGAGTVEIWDAGTVTTYDSTERKAIEKELVAGMKKGHIEFILHGNRLKGAFVLHQLDGKSWLLIKKKDHDAAKSLPQSTHKDKMPQFIPPMLATLIDEPFDSDEWLFEVKWDGYRAQAVIDKNKVALISRNKLSFNQKFPSIVQELQQIPAKVILDGEIVALDDKGKSHFQLLQNYKKKTALCYYVFDILYKDGKDLRERPLIERKEILKKFIKQLALSHIRYSDHVVRDGKKLFKAAEKEQLEGIIGKKITSEYASRRSSDWVKIKTSMRQEQLICGFTEPRGSRKKFGALLMGVYDNSHELQYVGHVGGGFSEKLLESVYKKLKPLVVKKCPFKQPPKTNMPVTWVKPTVLAEVSFSEWTEDKSMRHPVFKGVKEDKIFWPKEKYTKGDLLAYYEKVAPYILPYLKNRPITLHRFPDGITGSDFYQKNIENPPKGIKTVPVTHEGKVTNYLLIDSVKSLLYAIQLASIDLHPFLARKNSLDAPDYCVIDLDPHDIAFDAVVEAALEVHALLDAIGVAHYCKTSGGKGLHILIPLKGKYSFDQSKQFAELICHIVHKKLPKTTSLERKSEKRPKKIYLDYLQNRPGQSIAAPYSVRPRPGATVSTPITWKEVTKSLDPAAFTIETVPARLEKIGDTFAPVLGKGVNLKKAVANLHHYSI